MHCKECGQAIDEDSKFCRHCGAAQGSISAQCDQVVYRLNPSADKPAKIKDPDKTGQIIGIGAAGLLLVVVISQCSSGPTNITPPPAVAGVDTNASATAPEPAPTPQAQNWSYSTDEDKVRGSTTYYAQTTSTNRIFQASPYDGGTAMTMSVRKSPAYGTDVILEISEGQMMCPSYQGCSGMVRFDDGKAERVSFNSAADNSSEVVFVRGARSFIAKLKKAKKVTVEKTLYQAGNPQFEFDVDGLKWNR